MSDLNVTANAVIAPHPAPVMDLMADEMPAAEEASAPAAVTPTVKQEPDARPAYDPDIYCGVPPLPLGWGQSDVNAAAQCSKKPRIELPTPTAVPPLIPIAELAAALGIALATGIILGGSVTYLLSKPKVVCQA